jgi:hydroxysqualene dehydroxylase
MSARERPRVVVVGGGLAGLSAALACADAGAEVTLLEARARLGGATFSFRREGLSVDNGQHVFLRCCTAYRGFLRRLGVEGSTALQPRLRIPVVAPGGRTAWLRRGSLPAPLHLAGALARYGHLSRRDRARAGLAALAMARMRPGPELDDSTFGSWLASRGQSPGAVEALWNLIALPTLNLPAADASLALAVKVFRTGLLEHRSAGDVGYASVPLSALHADPAARAIAGAGASVRLRAAVRGIEPAVGGFAVRTEDGTAEADAVVLAVPHQEAASLLPPGAVADPDALARLGTSPIVNVHVVYASRVMDEPFVAGVGTPLQWAFDRTPTSGLERGQYLALSISGADAEIGERAEDLRARFLPALAELFPKAGTTPVERFFVTREHAATFRQAPGTWRLRPGPRTGIAGLYLAGAWTDTGWPATMEGAVRSGLAAAREAMASLGRTRLPMEVVA